MASASRRHRKALFDAIGDALKRQGWGLGWATYCCARASDGVLCIAGPPFKQTIGIELEERRPVVVVGQRIAASVLPRRCAVRHAARCAAGGGLPQARPAHRQGAGRIQPRRDWFVHASDGDSQPVLSIVRAEARGERSTSTLPHRSWPTTRAWFVRAVLTGSCRRTVACTGCRWRATAGKSTARSRWRRACHSRSRRQLATSPSAWTAPTSNAPAAADDWPMFRANGAGTATVPVCHSAARCGSAGGNGLPAT